MTSPTPKKLGRPSRFTDEQRQLIVDRYLAGAKPAELAKEFTCPGARIYEVVQPYAAKRRRDREDSIMALVAAGNAPKQIALNLNLDINFVYRIIRMTKVRNAG